ncbi:flocculation protein FLO11-like [Myripristis murdjan]|uniref:flocculation protein FLO11-like n=1 Tax=Myripristis murdjan TaxID=586833 RepID=UPI00117611D2|nr:flocculation protein FLO11-like [Myripristis murdjan]
MDLTRLAVDAGQLINRAVQYTGEALGQAERTEFNSGLEELLARAESTKTWSDQIISQTEVLLQPNPGARLEDRLYEHLDWSAPPRPRTHEVLGDHMTQAGLEMGPNTPYGTALVRCGEAQKQIGEAERKFVQSTNIHFLTPLRTFTEGEYRVIQDERRMLLNKRLDLDIAKTRLRKAHEAEAEARNLNANPLEDNYVAHVSYMFSFLRVKWLKIWAQEISQAEMELRICQSLFDRQAEITRLLLEGLSTTHTNHMRSLMDFVEGQACYYAQCHQHAQELQKQLASIPTVLCSNNWQSGITNAINQPSISSHVANDPVELKQVTPVAIIIHPPQGFNQVPPTANPLSGTEKATTGSSVELPPPDQTNTNNNNNTSSNKSQAPSWSSENNGQVSQPLSTKCSSDALPTAVIQAADQIFTSHSDSHSSDQLPSPDRTASALETVDPLAPSETTSQPLTSSEAAEKPVATTGKATGAASPPSQLNGSVSKTQTSISTTSETQQTSWMASEIQTTGVTANKTQSTNDTPMEYQVANNTANEIQTTSNTASRTQTPNDTANETQTTSDAVNEAQATSDTASRTQTPNDTANETQTTSDAANEAQTTSNTASRTQTPNDTANETQTTSDAANEAQTTSDTVNEAQTTSDTANEAQTTHDVGNKNKTTHDMVNEIQTTNSTANQTQTTHNTANETQSNHDVADEIQTTSSTADETQTTNNTANEIQITNGTVSKTDKTSGTASETPATCEPAAEPPAAN